MNNIKRKEIDEKIIKEIYTYEPEGFNEIKRSVNKGPRAVSLSLKRLTDHTGGSSLIRKNSKGLYCLSPKTRNKIERMEELDLPIYKRVSQSSETKQRISNTIKQKWKRDKTKERNSRIIFFILRLAATGVNFTGHIPPDFRRANLLPPDTWYSPLIETVPGVAVEDFFVGDRRDFATGTLKGLGFIKTEIKACVEGLVTKSILKPIYVPNFKIINTNPQRQRYEIVEKLLKEFIRDIQRLLYDILEYWIKELWPYERPKDEELRWYKYIASNMSYVLGRTYTLAIRDTLINNQQDKEIQRFVSDILIKRDKQYIEYLRSRQKTIAKAINKKWVMIGDKYSDVQINNPEIYKLLTEKAYPDFMHKYVSQYI